MEQVKINKQFLERKNSMHTLSRGTNFCTNSHIANGSLKRETLMLSDLGIALLEDTNESAC